MGELAANRRGSVSIGSGNWKRKPSWINDGRKDADMERQKNEQTDRQTDTLPKKGLSEICTHDQTDKETNRQTDMQTKRQT